MLEELRRQYASVLVKNGKFPVFHKLVNKQGRTKLCYLLSQVCINQSDSCRCLATGCEEDTLESISINPKGLSVAFV